MMAKRNIVCRGYIDDFLIICDSHKACKSALDTMTDLVASLGLSINWKKVEGPSTSITFLGMHIDTVRRTMALPEEKLQEVKTPYSTGRQK
jgi:hypothetical protein